MIPAKVELTGAQVAEAIGAYVLKMHPGAGTFDCSVSGSLALLVLLNSKKTVAIVELAQPVQKAGGS